MERRAMWYKCALCQSAIHEQGIYNHKCVKLLAHLEKPNLRFNHAKALYCVTCYKLFRAFEECDWYECGHRKHKSCEKWNTCCHNHKIY